MKEKIRALRTRYWLLGALLILAGPLFSYVPTVDAQDASKAVFVIQIRNSIDLGLAPYLARVLDQSAQEQAQAVILEIDTPGGRLDAALQMRDALLDSPVHTIAYVNRHAFSAGALIAIAANEIYMAPGAVMGAATPVDDAGQPTDEKTISAVRSTFRATAELRKRDPRVAEAMVDPAIAIEGLVTSGQLLTLATSQAQAVGYADGVAANRTELLAATGLAGVELQEPSPSLAEKVVRFLTHPLVAPLLVSIGFLLIAADIFSGGVGLIGGLGLALLALFFWGHVLAGLAGWEGIALVVVGLALIALEVFVIPGFGIAGIPGVVALLGGLFISLIGGDIVTPADLARAAYTVFATLVLIVVGGMLLLRFLPRAARLQGLILQSQVGVPDVVPLRKRRSKRRSWLEGDRLEAQSATYAASGREPVEPRSLRGAVGVALSDLRPGGIARIGDQRVDVVTRGDYIEAGEPIEVIADEGYRRIVRRVEQDSGGAA
ncbi:MAG: nodulation protein NfeD [Chloroflexota bacterium]|nr:nodulation protein NfeD [Chloroflexota bacterium]